MEGLEAGAPLYDSVKGTPSDAGKSNLALLPLNIQRVILQNSQDVSASFTNAR